MRKLPRGLKVTVYDKGDPSTEYVPLPNVGREAHTYLNHILEHYDELAEVTLFCQGRPFDHVPDFQKVVQQMMQGNPRVQDFFWMGFVMDVDFPDGSLFRDWSKNEDGRGLDLARFYTDLFGERLQPPATFPFFLGAHFAVTREVVLSRPRGFYEHALTVSEAFPDAAHCFERCWDKVFGVDGIPDEIKGLTPPVYLRPVKRLGITWEDVPVRPAHHR